MMGGTRKSDASLWTEGVCDDGAAILCDGIMVPIENIVGCLNYMEALKVASARVTRQVEHELPTHAQCATKARIGNATSLEQFIYDNEPAGPCDKAWRMLLALVLSEAIEEDRVSCMPEKQV